MKGGMQFDPIQDEDHESLKVENFPFQKLSPLPFTVGAGN